MRLIDPHQMAKLLEKGFEGEIRFSGRVFGRIGDEHPSKPNGNFYEANGEFRLLAPTSGREGYTLSLDNLGESTGSFRFAIRQGEKVSYSHDDLYGPTIGIHITLAPKAFLQLEPRNGIMY